MDEIVLYYTKRTCNCIKKTNTVISALQAATLFEADLKYRPLIGRGDINTGRI